LSAKLRSEKRKGLTAKRDSLFRQFAANPSKTETGQAIKKLDDQVAECEEHLSRQPQPGVKRKAT